METVPTEIAVARIISVQYSCPTYPTEASTSVPMNPATYTSAKPMVKWKNMIRIMGQPIVHDSLMKGDISSRNFLKPDIIDSIPESL